MKNIPLAVAILFLTVGFFLILQNEHRDYYYNNSLHFKAVMPKNWVISTDGSSISSPDYQCQVKAIPPEEGGGELQLKVTQGANITIYQFPPRFGGSKEALDQYVAAGIEEDSSFNNSNSNASVSGSHKITVSGQAAYVSLIHFFNENQSDILSVKTLQKVNATSSNEFYINYTYATSTSETSKVFDDFLHTFKFTK